MQSNLQPDPLLNTYIDGIKQQQPTAEQDLKMEQRLFASIDNFTQSNNEQAQHQAKQSASKANWLQVLTRLLFSKPKLNKYSLLGSFALACLLSVGLFLTSGVNSPAFANVVNKLEQISTMYYNGNMKSNGQAIMQLEVFYQAPSQLRIENTPAMGDNENQGAMINILDTSIGKGMILIPANKLAMPFNFSATELDETPDKNPLYWLDEVKQYKGEVVLMEPKVLNNQKVVGYQIYVSNITMTLWVNVNTEWPVQIEMMMDKVNGQSPFEFVADVEFNQYIDPSFFSLQPSDEYSTVKGDE
jgi:outer membrane lipoprotein-sorting protein